MAEKRRQTILEDPLGTILPGNADPKPKRRPPAQISTISTGQTKPQARKVRFTVHLPLDLIEEARNAVVALYGDLNLTLAGLTEEALRQELERLKKDHNKGRDFPQRNAAPRLGRPIR